MLKQYYCKIHVTRFDASPTQIEKYHLEPNIDGQSYQLVTAPASMARVRTGMLLATTSTGNTFTLTEKSLQTLFDRLDSNQYICLAEAGRITSNPSAQMLTTVNAVKLQTASQTIYVGDAGRFPLLYRKKPILLPQSYLLKYQTGIFKGEQVYDLKSSEEFNWLFTRVQTIVA